MTGIQRTEPRDTCFYAALRVLVLETIAASYELASKNSAAPPGTHVCFKERTPEAKRDLAEPRGTAGGGASK